MYLSYDPGRTTGWARFTDDGEAAGYGQLTMDELLAHVENMILLHNDDPIKVLIVEDFVLFGHKAQQQTGSRMEASQVIGILRTLAERTGAEFFLQPSNIKSLAEKWTQLSPKGMVHSKTHWIDAFNHGAYYLIKQGIRKTELERENDNKSKDSKE